MKKIAVVLGTRPEAIKCAPLLLALRDDPRFEPVFVSTGQHRQMLDETLEPFGLVPDLDLGVMRDKQTLTQVTHRILAGLSETHDKWAADAVVVHGDTATTLAGALAAFHHGIPVIHLEAGLRSGNVHSPFPEEANRRLVAQISALHLAPTPGNAENLIREGTSVYDIVVTGNTVIDALRWAGVRGGGYGDAALDGLDADPRRVVLASVHRRESWGMLDEIGRALTDIAADPGVRVVVPLHRNPRVRDVLLPILSGHSNITIVDPLPYLSFCKLMNRCDIVLSDSSGAEEEGPALGKPTLVLRDITERPEAVVAGTARLVGRTRRRIVSEVTTLLGDEREYTRMATAANPYGDGMATPRVVDAIAHFFGEGPPAAPFVPAAMKDVPIAELAGALS